MATSSRPRVLLDASALIAVIKDEPVASRVDGLLAMLDRGDAAKCIEWAEGCYQRGEDDAVRELNEMADFARGDR